MGVVFKPFFRILTLVGKELTQVARQPMMLLAMVLGPFLILLIFGVGHRSSAPPLRVALVIPTSVPLTRDPAFWRSRFGSSIQVVSVTSEQNSAVTNLKAGQVDLAVIVPANATADWSSGRSATIQVLHDQISPSQTAYLGYASYVLASEINKQLIARVATRLEQNAGALRSLAPSIPPSVLASPFTSRTQSILPVQPGFVAFYSPAVIALLLQHLTITIVALSLVGERLLGMIELYQVAPTSTLGLLAGKYVSYGIMSLGIGAVLTVLMIQFLQVPVTGNPVLFAAVLALLVFTSLGIGLVISTISSSQEHAVQLSMLILLASVFFSGFFLPLDTLQAPATFISDVLPVTYAISALQDIMFRGRLLNDNALLTLGAMALGFLILNVRLYNNQLSRQ